MVLIISAIVGGVTNLLGNALGYLSTKNASSAALQANRETNLANMQLQQQANDFNFRMWQENNAYNSLSSQVERAQQAGFSPNVVLNNGSYSNPVTQSSLPSLNSGSDILMQSGANAAQLLSGMGNSVSQTIDNALKLSQIDDFKQTATGKEIENQYKPELLTVQIKQIYKNIDQIDATINNILAEIEKKGAEVEKINKDSQLVDSQVTAQDIKNTNLFAIDTETLNLLRQQILSVSENTRFIGYNARTNRISANAQSQQAQIASKLATANIGLLEKTGLKVDAETKKLYQDSVSSYWQGKQTQAQYYWQKFSNNVRDINGAKYYADTERDINSANLTESTSRTAKNAVETATTATKTLLDVIKPW